MFLRKKFMHVHRLEKEFRFYTQVLLAVCAMQGVVEPGAPGQPEGVVKQAVRRSVAVETAAAADVAGDKRAVDQQRRGSSVEIEELGRR